MDDGNLRKKQMMDIARAVFTKKGYCGATMRNLAEAFECKPANIYNFFTSKENLLFEVLKEEMEEILAPVAHLEFEEISDPLDKLLFLIKHHAQVTLGYRRTGKMLFDSEMINLSPANRKVYVNMRRQYDRILSRLIQTGIDQGVFQPTNVKLTAYGIASMIVRSRVWFSPKGELKPDQIGDFIFRFVVAGLRGD